MEDSRRGSWRGLWETREMGIVTFMVLTLFQQYRYSMKNFVFLYYFFKIVSFVKRFDVEEMRLARK